MPSAFRATIYYMHQGGIPVPGRVLHDFYVDSFQLTPIFYGGYAREGWYFSYEMSGTLQRSQGDNTRNLTLMLYFYDSNDLLLGRWPISSGATPSGGRFQTSGYAPHRVLRRYPNVVRVELRHNNIVIGTMPLQR
jgi:hypothetical protein